MQVSAGASFSRLTLKARACAVREPCSRTHRSGLTGSSLSTLAAWAREQDRTSTGCGRSLLWQATAPSSPPAEYVTSAILNRPLLLARAVFSWPPRSIPVPLRKTRSLFSNKSSRRNHRLDPAHLSETELPSNGALSAAP